MPPSPDGLPLPNGEFMLWAAFFLELPLPLPPAKGGSKVAWLSEELAMRRAISRLLLVDARSFSAVDLYRGGEGYMYVRTVSQK